MSLNSTIDRKHGKVLASGTSNVIFFASHQKIVFNTFSIMCDNSNS